MSGDKKARALRRAIGKAKARKLLALRRSARKRGMR